MVGMWLDRPLWSEASHSRNLTPKVKLSGMVKQVILEI